jgi:hypothetical protein
LDGSNWQRVDLFYFQTDVKGCVIENIANRCNEFLKAIKLENCRWITDESILLVSSISLIKFIYLKSKVTNDNIPFNLYRKLCNKSKNIEMLNLKQCLKLTNM